MSHYRIGIAISREVKTWDRYTFCKPDIGIAFSNVGESYSTEICCTFQFALKNFHNMVWTGAFLNAQIWSADRHYSFQWFDSKHILRIVERNCALGWFLTEISLPMITRRRKSANGIRHFWASPRWFQDPWKATNIPRGICSAVWCKDGSANRFGGSKTDRWAAIKLVWPEG
jgi:hypothetical protein